MQNKLDKLIKIVYKKWKSEQPLVSGPHPDEETLACFIEGKLPPKESGDLIAHLIDCNSCLEVLTVQAKLKPSEEEVSQELVERVKNLVMYKDKILILEIVLALKEKALEILNTSGDILVGQELVPAAVLRSRKIKDFQDKVTILKDFKDIRVEAKIENKGGQIFDLTIVAKEKTTQKVIKDLRVTLIKDDLELESYLTETGSVTFEHVLLGKYTIEISSLKDKLASILLDIKT